MTVFLYPVLIKYPLARFAHATTAPAPRNDHRMTWFCLGQYADISRDLYLNEQDLHLPSLSKTQCHRCSMHSSMSLAFPPTRWVLAALCHAFFIMPALFLNE